MSQPVSTSLNLLCIIQIFITLSINKSTVRQSGERSVRNMDNTDPAEYPIAN
jgi:hypothetical protein